jgi:hypothetical protein
VDAVLRVTEKGLTDGTIEAVPRYKPSAAFAHPIRKERNKSVATAFCFSTVGFSLGSALKRPAGERKGSVFFIGSHGLHRGLHFFAAARLAYPFIELCKLA